MSVQFMCQIGNYLVNAVDISESSNENVKIWRTTGKHMSIFQLFIAILMGSWSRGQKPWLK